MKDLGEASHILGIKLLRDRQKRMLGPKQLTLIRFFPDLLEGSKKKFVSFRVGISLSSNQRPKTQAEIERMRGILYASAIESLMYAMLCKRPDICFVVGLVSRYQSDDGEEH